MLSVVYLPTIPVEHDAETTAIRVTLKANVPSVVSKDSVVKDAIPSGRQVLVPAAMASEPMIVQSDASQREITLLTRPIDRLAVDGAQVDYETIFVSQRFSTLQLRRGQNVMIRHSVQHHNREAPLGGHSSSFFPFKFTPCASLTPGA
jgi:hypothetical protein